MEGQNWNLFLEGVWKASLQGFETVCGAFVAALGSGKGILAQHYSSFHIFSKMMVFLGGGLLGNFWVPCFLILDVFGLQKWT